MLYGAISNIFLLVYLKSLSIFETDTLNVSFTKQVTKNKVFINKTFISIVIEGQFLPFPLVFSLRIHEKKLTEFVANNLVFEHLVQNICAEVNIFFVKLLKITDDI